MNYTRVNKRYYKGLLCIPIALALLSIVGWHLRIPELSRFFQETVAMKYNTALGILAIAIALTCLRSSLLRSFWVSLAISISSLTLIQYITGVNFGIDQLFVAEFQDTINTSHPGRMAPNTALGILLLSVVIMNLKNYVFASSMAAIVSAIAFVSEIGYWQGMKSAYGWGELTSMAPNTDISFMGLCAAIFLGSYIKTRKNAVAWIHWPILTWTVSSTLLILFALTATEFSKVNIIAFGVCIYGSVLVFAYVRMIIFARLLEKRTAEVERQEERIRHQAALLSELSKSAKMMSNISNLKEEQS